MKKERGKSNGWASKKLDGKSSKHSGSYPIVKLAIDNTNRKKDSPMDWTRKCEIMRIDYGFLFPSSLLCNVML